MEHPPTRTLCADALTPQAVMQSQSQQRGAIPTCAGRGMLERLSQHQAWASRRQLLEPTL